MISEVDRSDADHVQGKEDPVEQYVGVHDVINQFIPLFLGYCSIFGYAPWLSPFCALLQCFFPVLLTPVNN